MSNIDTESILQNNHAFKILEEGGHPLEFLTELGLSLQQHLGLYNTSIEYRDAFDKGCTAAMCNLIMYGRAFFMPSDDDDDYRTTTEQFQDIAHGRTRRQPKRVSNDAFQAYKHAVEDLERYMPCVKQLRSGDYYIPQTQEDLIFNMKFVKSEPQEPAIHE
jgi:hypothetical protein